MLISSKSMSLVLFAAEELTDSDGSIRALRSPLVSYGRSLSRTIRLFRYDGTDLGMFELPEALAGNFMGGHAKQVTLVKSDVK